MKKSLFIFIIICGLSACTIKKNERASGDTDSQKPSPQSLPSYSTNNLRGQVFGRNWNASQVYFFRSQKDPNFIDLKIFNEPVINGCDSNQNNTDLRKGITASLELPRKLKLQEFYFDFDTLKTNGLTPLIFSQTYPELKSVISSQTKIRIESITADGFKAALYSIGTDASGEISEINGLFEAVNCEKNVNFSFWKNLEGGFWLESFDGIPSSSQHHIRAYLDRGVVTSANSTDVHDMMVLPLLASVSNNSTFSIDLGPIEGMGDSYSRIRDGQYLYFYDFAGPIKLEGRTATITLNIELEEKGGLYVLKYKAKIPEIKFDESHKMTFRK